MIKLYVLPNHKMSLAAQRWFEQNKVPYQLKKVTDEEPLTDDEIMNLIYLVVDMDDLFSRIDICKKIKLKDMRIKSELIPFVRENPKVLRFPIVERNLGITTGYSLEEYGRFLPRTVRKKRFAELVRAANLEFSI